MYLLTRSLSFKLRGSAMVRHSLSLLYWFCRVAISLVPDLLPRLCVALGSLHANRKRWIKNTLSICIAIMSTGFVWARVSTFWKSTQYRESNIMRHTVKICNSKKKKKKSVVHGAAIRMLVAIEKCCISTQRVFRSGISLWAATKPNDSCDEVFRGLSIILACVYSECWNILEQPPHFLPRSACTDEGITWRVLRLWGRILKAFHSTAVRHLVATFRK